MNSSYKQNKYGTILYALVQTLKPKVCVELGVLEGYSTMYICKALEKKGIGTLAAYDIWDAYPYNHVSKSVSEANLHIPIKKGILFLHDMEAFIVSGKYADNSVDFIHIDISNHGDIFNTMLKDWHPKLKVGGVMVFEGGSVERDTKSWIAKYNKPQMHPAIKTNKLLKDCYEYIIIDPWPSMIICKKVKDVPID